MGDRCSASITIGGDLPEALCENLLDLIRDSGAGPDYGSSINDLFTGANKKLSHRARLERLMAECHAFGCQKHLALYDNEVNYGSFPDLEGFCKNSGLSYDLHHDSGGEYDAGNEYIRDGAYITEAHSTNNGDMDYVPTARIILARQALFEGNFHEAIRLLDEVVGDLWKLPPLPPFRIVP